MGIGMVVLLGALGVGAPPSDVHTMRNRHLEIPILINEAKRPELQELELHVSTDQGRTWHLAGRETPDQQAFKFHANSDGLYWFSVCAVDKAGNRDPADISAVPPALKVLINTQTPVLRIVAAERVGDEVLVIWDTQDTQADLTSLQLEYRADDGLGSYWQLVPIHPTLSGQTRFRPRTTGPITLRLQIHDSTGMPATVVKDLPAAAPTMALGHSAPVPPIPAPIMDPPAAPLPPPMTIQQANSISPPPSVPITPLGQMPDMVGSPPQPVPIAEVPPLPPAPAVVAPPQPPVAPVPAAPTPGAGVSDPGHRPQGLTPLAGLSGADSTPRPPTAAGVSDPGHRLPDLGSQPSPQTHPPLTDVQHVRDRQVAIEFEVERKGPSGVKRIQVYVTPDDGQTWFPYTETDQTISPLHLTLPEEEGQYGFRLVLYSGANQSVGPPRPGDPPDIRLQVDRTKPKVSLYAPTIAPGQPNALLLHYSVSDTHLNPNSVRLFWSAHPQGRWEEMMVTSPRPSSIDRSLKECTWSLPPELPDRVYFRLTASDLAGNEGEIITRDPVTVDLHKPTARVKGIILGPGRQP